MTYRQFHGYVFIKPCWTFPADWRTYFDNGIHSICCCAIVVYLLPVVSSTDPTKCKFYIRVYIQVPENILSLELQPHFSLLSDFEILWYEPSYRWLDSHPASSSRTQLVIKCDWSSSLNITVVKAAWRPVNRYGYKILFNFCSAQCLSIT